jgi:hypothetical protein
MVSYNKYYYYVLCEDRAHFNFVYGYLEEKGANCRKIKPIFDYPEGKGDAKDFVRSNYAQAVKIIKQKTANTILLVLCDADKDKDGVDLRFFDNDCTDKAFVAIPKQNIETWFYFLANINDSESANEAVDRKLWHRQRAEKPKPARCGKQLVDVINDFKAGRPNPNIPASLGATVSQIIKYEGNRSL